MSYLRFTPEEVRLLARLVHQLPLGEQSRSQFQRLLVDALARVAPPLSRKVARLRRSEMKLLFDYFYERPEPDQEHHFTPEEWRVVAEACISAPFHVRFVIPFKGVLIELFQDVWPGLSHKIARLSDQQFEQLYSQARAESRGSPRDGPLE